MGWHKPLSHPFSPLGDAATDGELQEGLLAKESSTDWSPAQPAPTAGGSVPRLNATHTRNHRISPSRCLSASHPCGLWFLEAPVFPMNQNVLPATLWATRPSRFKGSSADLDRSS